MFSSRTPSSGELPAAGTHSSSRDGPEDEHGDSSQDEDEDQEDRAPRREPNMDASDLKEVSPEQVALVRYRFQTDGLAKAYDNLPEYDGLTDPIQWIKKLKRATAHLTEAQKKDALLMRLTERA
ncbi:MAG: hypothetical protein AAGJ35_00255, partial [Myxococcota bacterium]